MNLVVTVSDEGITVEARDWHPVERNDVVAMVADLVARLSRELNRSEEAG